MLAEGISDAADVAQFVKLAKQKTGYAFRRKHGVVL